MTKHTRNDGDQAKWRRVIALFHNLDRVIALIASLAAAFTALFALSTLREMQEQRRESYKPHVDISNFTARVLAEKDHLFVTKTFINNSQNLIVAPEPVDAPEGDEVEVVNIGAGPAMDLYLQWVYDRPAFLAYLNSRFPTMKLKADFGQPWPPVSIGNASSALRILPPATLSYLLPLKDAPKPFKTRLPVDYLVLVGLGLAYCDNYAVAWSYFKALPPLYVKLTFKDVAGGKYVEFFRLDTESWVGTEEGLSRNIYFVGRFSVAELPRDLALANPSP